MEDYSPSTFNLPGSLSLNLSQPEVVPARAQAGPPSDLLYSPKLPSPLLSTLSTDFTWHESSLGLWPRSFLFVITSISSSVIISNSLFMVFLLNPTSWPSWPISLTSTLFLNLYILPQLKWKNSTKWFHILKKKSESSLQHLTKKTLIKSLMDFQCLHQAEITTHLLVITTRDRIALCHQVTSHQPLLILDFLKWAFVEEITLFIEP